MCSLSHPPPSHPPTPALSQTVVGSEGAEERGSTMDQSQCSWVVEGSGGSESNSTPTSAARPQLAEAAPIVQLLSVCVCVCVCRWPAYTVQPLRSRELKQQDTLGCLKFGLLCSNVRLFDAQALSMECMYISMTVNIPSVFEYSMAYFQTTHLRFSVRVYKQLVGNTRLTRSDTSTYIYFQTEQ